MAKIDVNKVELVWPGKYNEDGTLKEVPRVHLPFQVIETVNESRASREAAKKPENLSLFDVYEGKEGDTFEEGWKNKLIWGDNLLVMGSLLEKFAGKIDLIYIDPPFATGTDFSFTTAVGDDADGVEKEASALEEKAYRDTWCQGTSSYLQMMRNRFQIMHELLADRGSIYVHCDSRMNSALRAVMDEVFGADRFVNEIIWKRSTNTSSIGKIWKRAHDHILFYTKSDEYVFNFQYKELSDASKLLYSNKDDRGQYQLVPILVSGKRGGKTGESWHAIDPNSRGRSGMHWVTTPAKLEEKYQHGLIVFPEKVGGIPRLKYYLEDNKGVVASDLWDDIKLIASSSTESLQYPTQKPETLIERLLSASTDEGQLVADFFCGSGTTLAVAEKLGRRWVGCDLGRYAIHTTRKRLLGIEGAKPFEVLNLGKYERKYWMGATFGGKKDEQRTIYEYIAFILKLYGAQPLPGTQHLHGKKGKAMVHIGAVDAPVTIDEVNAAIEECVAVNQSELHVLGWEWEMGMSPYIVQQAKHHGIKLLLLNIPREVMEQQAVDKGDIKFFELAHVEVNIKQLAEREMQIELTDFAFPYADLIPQDVRDKITKWSDYVDYWAIDWDFGNDTFMQGWVAYRTRKERSLALISDSHTYDAHKTVNVMIKVVDIFGNDTSQVFTVEV